MTLYERIVPSLEKYYTVYGVTHLGYVTENMPYHTSIEELAAFYLENIKTLSPNGPYRLGGLSSGGILSLEMAKQLQEKGEANR